MYLDDNTPESNPDNLYAKIYIKTRNLSILIILGNTHHNMDGHISTSTTSQDSDLYTSMEALNNSSFGDNRRRVKVLPDIEPRTKPMPSRTNPNVVFKRPNSMTSMMY